MTREPQQLFEDEPRLITIQYDTNKPLVKAKKKKVIVETEAERELRLRN